MEQQMSNHNPWNPFLVFRSWIQAKLLPTKIVTFEKDVHPEGKQHTGVEGTARGEFLRMEIGKPYRIETLREVLSLKQASRRLFGKAACTYKTIDDHFVFWRLK